MTSTADMDQYALFSVSAEITFPVASLVATMRQQKRQVEVSVSFSNQSATPTLVAAIAALPTADAAIVNALDLKDYALADGGAPRKNEFGLLDGTVTWRIPVRDEDAGNGEGLWGTWGKSADRVTLRIRGDYQEEPIFPTLAGLTDSAVSGLVADFLGTGESEPDGTPIVTTTADMDAYGLFTVSAEITWHKSRIIVSIHPHRRWVDVEVAFYGCADIPGYPSSGASSADLAATSPSIAQADVVTGSYITASLSVRGDEFGTLYGEVVYRVPVRSKAGWTKLTENSDEVVYRFWGWNQAETGGKSGNNVPLFNSNDELNEKKSDVTSGSGAVLYTHRVDVDYNEFGLLDYVITATGDIAPYNAGSQGAYFKSGKEPARYRFRANHTGASNPTTNTGFVELVYTTHWTCLGCYSTFDDAQTAASTAVTNADASDAIQTSFGRHGRWHTLSVTKVNHSNVSA